MTPRSFRSSLVVVLSVVLIAGAARGATTPAQKCANAKQRAVLALLSARLKCFATAAKKNLPVDSTCLAKATAKFGAAYFKAEERGGCVATGDLLTVRETTFDVAQYLVDVTTKAPCGGIVMGFVCGGSCPIGQTCTAFPLVGGFSTCSCNPN